MHTSCPRRHRRGRRRVRVAFTGENLTRFAGAFLLHRFFQRLHLRRHFRDGVRFRQRNNAYSIPEMLLALLYPMILGYTAVTAGDVSPGVLPLYDLKHSIIAEGVDLQYFHAAEDRQNVRNRAFEIIGEQLPIRIDSIVIEKRKAGPSLRPIEHIYPRMFQIPLRYVLERPAYKAERIYVFFDTPGVRKAKDAVEKGIKEAMTQALGPLLTARTVQYHALMHDSKSHPYLQVADYCGWAIYRKWQNSDTRSYDLIRHLLWSEFDVFRHGGYHWY